MPNRSKTDFIKEPPIIKISGGVAHGVYRSGERVFDRALSIRVLAQTHDRIGRALELYAKGEDNIVVDS